MGEVTILRAGPLTSVQDLGRPGHRKEGISPGGALDLFAARIANLLVGNREEAALLEIALGGLRLRFEKEGRMAWCGGDFAVDIEKMEVPPGRMALVRTGEELTFQPPRRGCRAWLALAGGIDLPLVLGSRATDLRAGFGGFAGRALTAGDRLSLGQSTLVEEETARLAPWSAPTGWTQTALRDPVLRFIRGAEWDEFKPEAQKAWREQRFTVSAQADRMGARLEGLTLQRRNLAELPSTAVAPGTVQVTNEGQAILLLGDCQTIGGYPKIAHVITVDLPFAAQLRPNDRVRFVEVTAAAARTLYLARAQDLQRFRVGLALRAG